MSLLKSPFSLFSRYSEELGQVQIDLNIPWSLPWTIDALRIALAWEVTAACEEHQLLIPKATSEALKRYGSQEFKKNSYEWLDGIFSKNSARILDSIADDLSRVYPKPTLIMESSVSSEEDTVILSQLAKFLSIELQFRNRSISELAHSPNVNAAVRLLGSCGIINAELLRLLITAARRAGDGALADELSKFEGEKLTDFLTFSAYETDKSEDERLASTLSVMREMNWHFQIPDWQNLALPSLLEKLWANPLEELDHFRKRITQNLREVPNAFQVRLNIARHFLRCFLDDGIVARLDLLEASVNLKTKHPTKAWKLLVPHIGSKALELDPILAAHVHGQAGLAASRLGQPLEALTLYEQNLKYLKPAFGESSLDYKKARANLEHKLGQLIREKPELPGGIERARALIESSLQLHKNLDIPRGISMCLSEMGELAIVEEAYEEAERWFEDALTQDRKAENIEGQSRVLHQMAVLQIQKGEFETALNYIEQCEQAQSMAGVSKYTRQQVLNTKKRIQNLLGLATDSDATDTIIDIQDTTLFDDPRTFTTYITHKTRILRQSGRIVDAQKVLKEALERPIPTAAKNFLSFALISLLLDLRQHDQARAMLQEVKSGDKATDAEHKLLLARLESQSGNLEAVETIISELSTDAKPDVNARLQMLRGKILFEQKLFGEAAIRFLESRNYSRNSPYSISVAMEREAIARLKSGEYAAAESLCRELIKMAVVRQSSLRHMRALMALGDSLLHLGHAQKAAQEYDYAMQITNDIKDNSLSSVIAIERRIAKACLVAGNSHAAITHIENAMKLLDEEPNSATEQRGWIYLLAANIYRSNGDNSKYKTALDIAEKYAFDNEDASLQQAIALHKQGDWRQDSWETDDFDWDGDDVLRSAVGQARRLRARGKFKDAVETLLATEQIPATELLRREILELMLAINLDLKEAGQEFDAEALLKNLVANRPDSELTPKLLLLRSRAELLDRKYELAIRSAQLAYDKAQKYNDFFSIARAVSILSKALGETGEQLQAVSILLQIADYMQNQGRQQFAFDARYSASRHLIEMRNFSEAIKNLQMLENDLSQLSLKNWVSVQLAYANIERFKGQVESAEGRLNNIMQRATLEKRPELINEAAGLYDTIQIEQGKVRQHNQRTVITKDSKQNAVKLNASSIKSLLNSGHHLEAIALAEKVLEKSGNFESRPRAIELHIAAQAYLKGNDVERAETLCRKSLELHKRLNMSAGIPGVRVTLARLLAKSKEMENAREQLSLALEENRQMSNSHGIEICERLLQSFSGETPKSGRPCNARDLIIQSRTIRAEGKNQAATKMLFEAVDCARLEDDPLTEATALGALGINSFHAGDYVQAIDFLEQAVNLHSDLESIYVGECSRFLAQAYMKRRKRPNALRLLEKTLAGKLTSRDRGKLTSLLSRLKREIH